MASQEERRVEICRLAMQVLGDSDAAHSWMSEPAIGLNRQIPAELIDTAEGAQLVKSYLMQIEHGVYV